MNRRVTFAARRSLSPAARGRLTQRIFATSARQDLHQIEQQIARNYAAAPAQRAANDEQLQWLRSAARARREMVAR